MALMLVTRYPVATFVAPGQEAEASGVSLRIDFTEWLNHEDAHQDQGEVFPMPASSMPGMPEEGLQRLQVELTLQNLGDASRDFRPEEFSVRSVSGESWPPMASTFQPGTLGPGQALNGVVFFDVPEAESGVYLVWTRGGTQVYNPIGDVPVHDH